MNRKLIFGIVGIFSILCGLIFLVLPHQAMVAYNVGTTETVAFMFRYLGLWMFGAGLLFWLLRSADSLAKAVKSALFGAIAITVLGLVVSFWNLVVSRHLGLWINIGLYLISFILVTYLYFKKAD